MTPLNTAWRLIVEGAPGAFPAAPFAVAAPSARPPRLPGLLLVFLLLLSPCLGNDSPTNEASSEIIELEPFHVRAYTLDLSLGQTAAAPTVIGRQTILDSGSESVADLLRIHAGIPIRNASGAPGQGEVDLRGYGENSGLRTLILVDGHKLNRPDMGVPSWMEIPPGHIERIEVLRGSQSARFGDHAVGGVINIVTRLGESAGPDNTLQAGAGSDAARFARILHNGTIGGADYAATLDRQQSDGYRDNSGFETTTLGLNAGRDFSGQFSARWGLSWTDEYIEFPGPLTRQEFLEHPRRSPYTEANVADQFNSSSTRWNGRLAARYQVDDDFSIHLRSAFSHRSLRWNQGAGSHADNRLLSLSLDPGVHWHTEEGSVIAGVNLGSDRLDLDFFRSISRDDSTGRAEVERDSASIFVAAERDLTETLLISGALRFSWNRLDALSNRPNNPGQTFDQQSRDADWAAQLGIRYSPTDSLALFTRYDRLYRFPVTDEVASYQGFPLLEPFNAALEPETGHNLDVGGEWNRGGLSLRATGFLQWLDGEIAFDFRRNLNVNLADTRRVGLETSLSWAVGSWRLGAFHTWIDAEYQSGPYAGKEVYLVPRHFATASLGWQASGWLFLQLEGEYASDAFEGNDFSNTQPKLPGRTLFHLLVRISPHERFSLFLRLNNLGDERYATLKFSGAWYPEPGRHWRAGARWSF